jgi:hypothetical protein
MLVSKHVAQKFEAAMQSNLQLAAAACSLPDTYRFILLASSFGRTLVAEARDRAPFLFSESTVAKPLLHAAGRSLLEQWLKQLQECPRLQPMHKCVYVVV